MTRQKAEVKHSKDRSSNVGNRSCDWVHPKGAARLKPRCWRDHLELGHAEELQQAQMHDHTHSSSELPAAKTRHQEVKSTNSQSAEQPFSQRQALRLLIVDDDVQYLDVGDGFNCLTLRPIRRIPTLKFRSRSDVQVMLRNSPPSCCWHQSSSSGRPASIRA